MDWAKRLFVLVALFGIQERITEAADFCSNDNPRTACAGATYTECLSYGCCWSAMADPPCFFQTPTYIVMSTNSTSNGMMMMLKLKGAEDAWILPGSPLPLLKLVLINESSHRLHIKITDPSNQRWEIPESLLPTPPVKPVLKTFYSYQFPAVGEEFYFVVIRKDDSVTVFNTSTMGFIFANQFLKISTSYSIDDSIYGFGEHKTTLKLNNGVPKVTYTLWCYDGGTPGHLNLYGAHPFYMAVTNSGNSHGVFLRNSNGMDIDVTNNSITYNIIGGVLDFYFFLGTQPNDVINQYQEVIGRPSMPPYWAMGYHQCRYGYKNLQEVKDVVSNFSHYKIPLDTVWTDIDYMDGFKDFTTDPVKFPGLLMEQFVNELHDKGMHYVVIVDPAISVTKGYTPYDDGIKMDIFVKNSLNEVFVGKVWPGASVFPDFSYSLTTEYWTDQIAAFTEQLDVDGIWIDMNEPSNFCDGACNKRTPYKYHRVSKEFDPIHPPYDIGNRRIQNSMKSSPLNEKTLDMDAVHHGGATAYNMHNLYGLSESIATRRALMSVYKGKRPFVLSRSTFAGSGVHAAHWLGDNVASAGDLYYSIPTILSFQIFGVPLVGADICGFSGDTTEELCARWMELGAFYPFSRNHNNKGASSQEPYLWKSVAAISRKYLGIRYSLLPYYYTLFFKASQDPQDSTFYPTNGVVLQPLFFAFSGDSKARTIDNQFLVGSALLICPQYQLGDQGTVLDVYLPAAVWYDWHTQEQLTDGSSNTLLKSLSTPLDFVPMYIRGGHIIPMQGPGLTTYESRKNPYSLLVALDHGLASGSIYLDDGETYDTTEFTYVSYLCSYNELQSIVIGTNYASMAGLPTLLRVTILGLPDKPTEVTLDGVPLYFSITEGKTFNLMIDKLSINMDTKFNFNWK